MNNYVLGLCIIIIVLNICILVLWHRCKKQQKTLDKCDIILSAHFSVLLNKVISSGDTRDVKVIAKELKEEVQSCVHYFIEHENEIFKNLNEDGYTTINKDDK